MKAFIKSPLLILSVIILTSALFGCSSMAPANPEQHPSADPTRNALSSLAQIQTQGVLIVGTALTEPFVFHDPVTDELIGFDIDLASQIADYLGVTLEIVEMPFANLIPALQEHKVDMTIAAMYITADREKLVDFSQPYLDTGLVMVAHPELQQQINTIQDLAGLRIGVKIGATGAIMAQKLISQGIDLKIVEYKDTIDSLLDLEVRRVDVIFNDYLNTLVYIKNTRSDVQIITNQTGDVNFLSVAGLGIAVQQNSPELIGSINTLLNEIEQDGNLDTMYKSWLLPTVNN